MGIRLGGFFGTATAREIFQMAYNPYKKGGSLSFFTPISGAVTPFITVFCWMFLVHTLYAYTPENKRMSPKKGLFQ